MILDIPPAGGFPDLAQVPKQVQVKHFVLIDLVKTFDERVPKLASLAG
jgi:hypothetical protein